MGRYAQVIVDIASSNVDRVFDYILPDDIDAEPGSRVSVPFGSRTLEGCVLSVSDTTDCEPKKLRAVTATLDDIPIITREQLKLAEYLRREYRTTLAFALRFMFPANMRGGRIKDKTVRMAALCENADIAGEKRLCYTKDGRVKAKNRLTLLEALEKGDVPTSGYDSASVRALSEKGVLRIYESERYRTPYTGLPADADANITLNDAQRYAVDTITERVRAGEKKTVLLHGVTGSGKTEVYMHAVKNALDMGKTAIILVPEISLTPQLFSKFSARFGSCIAVFHSGLSAGERYDEWKRVRFGEARIVMGARSAIFMPLENIGLIIIDEEHEQSYKADNHPPYHAADIARIRSAMNGAVLVLASATPRIESYMKAELGIYELITLPDRVRGLLLPEIRIVDMRTEMLNGNASAISGALYNALKTTLSRGEQALLFLNRRGYAASVQCAACGEVMMCTHCDVPLKYHRATDSMVCHYCGRSFPFEKTCKHCGEPFMRKVGMGTELVEKQIAELFPQARLLRMDFDTTRAKDSHERIYTAFKNHEADILIGTQMIARGLDFDDVTLAAVISADTLLTYGDFRAEERTFSMIEQVGGRAGRKKPGLVIVQTCAPSHYAIRFAAQHDYYGMYRAETSHRQSSGKPPYARIFRLLFTAERTDAAERVMRETEAEILPLIEEYKSDILLFAAKPAPVSRLDGKARFHIILKVIANARTTGIKNRLYDIWESAVKKGVRVSFDIDPNDIN